MEEFGVSSEGLPDAHFALIPEAGEDATSLGRGLCAFCLLFIVLGHMLMCVGWRTGFALGLLSTSLGCMCRAGSSLRKTTGGR